MDDEDTGFEVTRRLEHGTAVVQPVGEIDLATADAVREELLAAAAEATTVVLDLRDVGFMDSSALRLLVEMQRRSEADGFGLVLVRGPASLRRLLELSGLDRRVRVVDDLEQVAGDDGPAAA